MQIKNNNLSFDQYRYYKPRKDQSTIDQRPIVKQFFLKSKDETALCYTPRFAFITSMGLWAAQNIYNRFSDKKVNFYLGTITALTSFLSGFLLMLKSDEKNDYQRKNIDKILSKKTTS